MNRNHVPTLDRLERRELLTAQPNPTDPVLPPDGGKLHLLIIQPVPNPTPLNPPNPVIA